nr:uncharacterized protein LOC109165100 [Ipomoea batatas]
MSDLDGKPFGTSFRSFPMATVPIVLKRNMGSSTHPFKQLVTARTPNSNRGKESTRISCSTHSPPSPVKLVAVSPSSWRLPIRHVSDTGLTPGIKFPQLSQCLKKRVFHSPGWKNESTRDLKCRIIRWMLLKDKSFGVVRNYRPLMNSAVVCYSKLVGMFFPAEWLGEYEILKSTSFDPRLPRLYYGEKTSIEVSEKGTETEMELKS